MKLRLHQYLSKSGLFPSKKGLVAAIRQGLVKIGSEVIVNPEFIFDPSKKQVFVNGNQVSRAARRVYLLLNKPEGYLSSRLSQNDRKLGKKSVFELMEKDKAFSDEEKNSLFCVGRLDEDTSGLLVITNDGKFGSALTQPDAGVKKTYLASLANPIGKDEIATLEGGVDILLEENGSFEKYRTKGCSIEQLEPRLIKIIISEGKKREVRRMLEAIGNKVVALERIAIGKLVLESLKLEKGRYISANAEMLKLAQS